MKFVIDEETELSDANNFLNGRVYVNALKKMIQQKPAHKPFTIGLFGEWGSGKSSIIKTVKVELESDQKTKFVTFDAWKYEGDAFRRSFIITLQNQLNVTLDPLKTNLYVNVTQKLEQFKFKISKYVWVLIGCVASVSSGLFFYNPVIGEYFSSFIKLLIIVFYTATFGSFAKWAIDNGLIGKSAGLVREVLFQKYKEEKPFLFSPEQFSDAFKEIIEQSKFDNVVIVIDNLDRCERHYTVELLGTIKGFLESRDVVFILPVDERALKKHVKSNFNGNDRDADEFLRKFFNVTLRVKPYKAQEIYVFAKEINNTHGLGFSDLTVDLVSKEYASNPRRIIQLFNNLSTELQLFDIEFAKRLETIICKFLIIREEFPEYYDCLQRNPYNLEKPDDEILKLVSKQTAEGLMPFLNKTRIITENVLISDIFRIVSNSNVFNLVPAEVAKYVDNLNVEDLDKFINLSDDKAVLTIDYLISEMAEYADRNVLEFTFMNLLDVVSDLDDRWKFHYSQNTRIEEVLKPVLNTVVEQRADLSKMIKYGKSITSHGRRYITDEVLRRLNKEASLGEISEKWRKVFFLMIDNYRNDIDVVKKLRPPFLILYNSNIQSFDLTEFNDMQIEALLDEEIMSNIVEQIVDISDNDINYRNYKDIASRSKLANAVERTFLAKVESIYPSFQGMSLDEVIEALPRINLALNVIQSDVSTDVDVLTSLSRRYNDNISVPHSSYPGQSMSANFLKYSFEQSKMVDELLVFSINIYRLSGGKVDMQDVFRLFLSHDSDSIKESVSCFIREMSDRFKTTLTPLTDFIIDELPLSEDGYKLLSRLIVERDLAGYKVGYDVVFRKFMSILDEFYTGPILEKNPNEFFENVINDERAKAIFIEVVTRQSKSNINKLPISLLRLVINSVMENGNIFDYGGETEFLKIVATFSDSKHRDKLVKLLLTKIPKESDLEQALLIIGEFEELTSDEATILTGVLNMYEKDSARRDVVRKTISKIKDITIKTTGAK